MTEARLWFPSPERLIAIIFLQRCSLFFLCSYVQLKPVLLYLVAIMSADEAPRPCFIPKLIVVWIFSILVKRLLLSWRLSLSWSGNPLIFTHQSMFTGVYWPCEKNILHKPTERSSMKSEKLLKNPIIWLECTSVASEDWVWKEERKIWGCAWQKWVYQTAVASSSMLEGNNSVWQVGEVQREGVGGASSSCTEFHVILWFKYSCAIFFMSHFFVTHLGYMLQYYHFCCCSVCKLKKGLVSVLHQLRFQIIQWLFLT